MFTGLNISYSGLLAEKTRLSVISNNIANASTTRSPEGGPYRRKVVSFHAVYDSAKREGFAGRGVRVAGVLMDASPLKPAYEPSHPDADELGYVRYPNVDISQEMVDLVSASRAYEANIAAFNAEKNMLLKTLEIGV